MTVSESSRQADFKTVPNLEGEFNEIFKIEDEAQFKKKRNSKDQTSKFEHNLMNTSLMKNMYRNDSFFKSFSEISQICKI